MYMPASQSRSETFSLEPTRGGFATNLTRGIPGWLDALHRIANCRQRDNKRRTPAAHRQLQLLQDETQQLLLSWAAAPFTSI